MNRAGGLNEDSATPACELSIFGYTTYIIAELMSVLDTKEHITRPRTTLCALKARAKITASISSFI